MKMVQLIRSPLIAAAMFAIVLCHAACGQILSIGSEFADLAGNYSDRGIDIDEDGKLDYLIIDAGVHIIIPGEYSISGYLYDHDNREIVWSADHRNFTDGYHTMQLAFDGKTIEKKKRNGPYRLGNVTFTWGSASGGLIPCEIIDNVYTTGQYNASDFVDPIDTDKILSGSGNGELLLTLTINKTIPVFSGRYMYDIVGLNMPPLSTPIKVNGSKTGYDISIPGIFMPKKPNNFTVMAHRAKNINVGVMKLQKKLERTWISSQFPADDTQTARADTDLISPNGSYHVKIFGDAADNETQVDLMMSVTKKLVINGHFDLAINTTGFPEGHYRINARALNGSFSFEEMDFQDQ